jgi:hypothetical protein
VYRKTLSPIPGFFPPLSPLLLVKYKKGTDVFFFYYYHLLCYYSYSPLSCHHKDVKPLSCFISASETRQRIVKRTQQETNPLTFASRCRDQFDNSKKAKKQKVKGGFR